MKMNTILTSGLMFFSTLSYAQPGSLDPTFGTVGIAESSWGRGFSSFRDNSENIFVAGIDFGSGDYDLRVTKFLQNGLVDNSYGNLGSMILDVNNGIDVVRSIGVQSNGKIIVAGYAEYTSTGNDWYIARFSTVGSLDPAFNGQGFINEPFSGQAMGDEAVKIIVLPDDKFLVIGSWRDPIDFNSRACVIKYNADGTKDLTYGVNGISSFYYADGIEACDAELQSDGKLIVGITIDNNGLRYGVIRFNVDGTIDNTFGNSGILELAQINSYDLSIIKDIDINNSTDEIYIAGLAEDNTTWVEDFSLIKLSSQGVLETSFGMNGIFAIDLGSNQDKAFECKVMSDGKILLGGETYLSSVFQDAILRINSDGNIDAGFGNNGVLLGSMGTDGAIHFFEDLGNKFIAGGEAGIKITLGRFNYECTQDLSLTFNGNSIISNQADANYQWLDCNSAMALITGEISQELVLTQDGNYAVEITIDGCVDTSDCMLIEGLGLNELKKMNVKIFPNPSMFNFTVESENEIEQVAIYNMAGERMMMEMFTGTTSAELTPQLNSGVYLVKVTDTAGNLHITQWIKL